MAKRRSVVVTVAGLLALPAVMAAGTSPVPRPAPAAGAPTIQRDPTGDRRDPSTLTAFDPPAQGGQAIGGAWKFIGPQPIAGLKSYVSTPAASWGAVSGRVTTLAVDPTNSATVFAGSADGGVWKSTDAGLHWAPAGNSDTMPSLVIGAIGIDATGQQLLAGTGEINGSESLPGQGILKSSNGGASWSIVATNLAGKHLGGITFDSTTSGSTAKVLAASDGGLYKSANGGATFARDTTIKPALHAMPGKTVSQATFEVVQDPVVPTHFYVSAGDRCATESGDIVMYDTVAKTWTNVMNVQARFGQAASRIALAMGRDGKLWMFAADCNGTALAIDWKAPASATWTSVTGSIPANLLQVDPTTGTSQGDYDIAIGVDPTSSQKIVVGGVSAAASSNGGNSFTDVGKVFKSTGKVHADFHAIAFTGASTFYAGNDGGVYSSANLGTNWKNLNATLRITQWYSGTANDLTHLAGGAQDNSVSGYWGSGNLPSFKQLGFAGDGTGAALDPTTGSTLAFGVAQNGFVYQSSTTNIALGTLAGPCDGATPPSTACGDSTGFVTPFVLDPNHPKRLLAGTNRVWEDKVANVWNSGLPAGDGGWSAISPPLTVASTVCTKDWLDQIALGGVGQPGIIYTSSFCGAVSRTLDGGKTWTAITGNLPAYTKAKRISFAWPWVSDVTFNPWNVDEAWVVLTSVGGGHVFHTTNASLGGATTWTDLSGNLPNEPVAAVAVDPRNPSTVYIGTAAGAMACTTCGGTTATGSWSPLGTGLPNVWVNRITFTRDLSSLVAWTHGRGAWSLPVTDPTPQITSFPLPAGSIANEIAAGTNGLWYALRGTDQIGLTDTPAGHQRSFPVTAGSAPWSVAAGPDGNTWFVEFNGLHMGKVKPTGAVTEFTTLFNTPDGITTGADGNLWVSVLTSTHVNALDTAARPLIGVAVTGKPRGVVMGPDGNIWAAETNVGKIARITPAGTLTEFTVPGGGQTLVAAGPDGNVWFTEAGGMIGRVTPAGVVTEFTVGGLPVGIATGPDGNLWVATGANIVRVLPSGVVFKTYPVPAGESAYAITAGPDGAMWFTMRGASDAIGRFNIAKG